MARRKPRFFAAVNYLGFANTWDVHVFNSRRARNQFVIDRDGYTDGSRRWVATEIPKSLVSYYVTTCKEPRPFTGEFWGIEDDRERLPSWPEGYIGFVRVCSPDERKFCDPLY